MRNIHNVEVMWSDCDPAQIVYHAHYFRWMDDAAHILLSKAGLDWDTLMNEYGVPGVPLLSASAEFRSTAKFGDTLNIESWAIDFGNSSFTMNHVIHCDGRIVAEGRQKRIWCRADPADTSKLMTFRIPDDVRAKLGAEESA